MAGDDLEVAVGALLDEHEELAVDDEGAALLVGEGWQVVPGLAAIGAAEDAQGAAEVGVPASPFRGGDQQGAVVEAGQVGSWKK